MACAQAHGRCRAGEVEIVVGVVGELGGFFKGVYFFGSEVFQFVDGHADGFFLVGGYVAEICHQLADSPFFA